MTTGKGPPTIGLLGDVMLGRAVGERLAAGQVERVWSEEVLRLARACDLVVLNLECCLSERGEPTRRVPGKPFFFRAPPRAAGALTALGNVAAGLANNHALDYGQDALLDTMEILREAGIPFAGAGAEVEGARQGTVALAAGRRIGLLALSDHPVEFAAGPDSAGIAHADLRRGVPGWVAAELGRLRERCDVVIAFPHWGPNMTSEPAAWQRKAAAELQALGADLVAGHSSHVFHGAGWGERGPLLFDLGDALDDYAVDPVLRNDLGVMALWRPGGLAQPASHPGDDLRQRPELEPVGLRLDFCRTELARGADAEWIARRLEGACAALGTRVERSGAQRFAVHPGGQEA